MASAISENDGKPQPERRSVETHTAQNYLAGRDRERPTHFFLCTGERSAHHYFIPELHFYDSHSAA